MAQATAVQREPSMEEILASIRRIIEDSDPQRQTANDDAPAATAGARAAPTEDEAEAFRAELHEAPERPAPPPQAAPPAREAVSMPPAERPAAPVAQFRPTPPADMALRASDAAPRRIEPEIIPASVARAEPPQRIEERIETARAEPQAALAPKPESVALERPAPKQSIISEQAGRQVAAAFGELSDAFAASRRKSFDEMAEEMMRPLLHEWMDNNLPLLVERLVREEIERVARGGAR